MRLIQTKTLELHEFSSGDIPSYAILSHTWGPDEVSFADIKSLKRPSHKAGFNKIIRSCQKAQSLKLQYIWIDTCCIDKTNSVELSESINSMFQWYQEAAVCLVHLADVDSDVKSWDITSGFPETRWFTRGWTLQELIASDLRIFWDSKWKVLGYSSKDVLRGITRRILDDTHLKPSNISKQLTRATGIPIAVLKGCRLAEVAIAERMSWAANRQTTRKEDEAYCLMGIFNVNLPLLYGEGTKAFTRLQEEILKSSDDQSIFVHISPVLDAPIGLFAQSPAFFSFSGDVGKLERPSQTIEDAITMTKHGIRIHCLVCPVPDSSASLIILECSIGRSNMARPALYLEQLKSSEDLYFRYEHRSFLILSKNSETGCDLSWRGEPPDCVANDSLGKIDFANMSRKTIQVLSDRAYNLRFYSLPTIRLEHIPASLFLLSVDPEQQWYEKNKTFLCSHRPVLGDGVQAAFHFRERSFDLDFVLLIGLHFGAAIASSRDQDWECTPFLSSMELKPPQNTLISKEDSTIEADDSNSLGRIRTGPGGRGAEPESIKKQDMHIELFSGLLQVFLRATEFLGHQELSLQIWITPEEDFG